MARNQIEESLRTKMASIKERLGEQIQDAQDVSTEASERELELEAQLVEARSMIQEQVWFHNVGIGSLIYPSEQVCDESGEDPKCSRSVLGNNIVDHLEYFGVKMGCDEERKCRIFMNSALADNAIHDDIGNLDLSKYPSSELHDHGDLVNARTT